MQGAGIAWHAAGWKCARCRLHNESPSAAPTAIITVNIMHEFDALEQSYFFQHAGITSFVQLLTRKQFYGSMRMQLGASSSTPCARGSK